MFKRSRRLNRSSFPRALSGERLTTKHLTLVATKEALGYAVVVPKSVARLSTTRHLLKRRIFAMMRTLPLPPGLVVFPRMTAAGEPYAALREELAHALIRLSR